MVRRVKIVIEMDKRTLEQLIKTESLCAQFKTKLLKGKIIEYELFARLKEKETEK